MGKRRASDRTSWSLGFSNLGFMAQVFGFRDFFGLGFQGSGGSFTASLKTFRSKGSIRGLGLGDVGRGWG